VHSWVVRYEALVLPGLADRSRRPLTSPNELSPTVVAMVCGLRRICPRWGAQRIAHGLTFRGVDEACLQREVSARESHGGEGRIRAARFPARKSLEEFDFDHARGLKRELIAHLGTVDDGVVSRRGRNTSLDSGGCVGIVASGEEGAGASSAVDQTSAFHGVAGSRLERALRSPRSRCIAILRGKLVAWTQGLPQWRRGRVRPAPGSASGPPDQHAVPVPRRAHRDR
jgi:hypothetical protein